MASDLDVERVRQMLAQAGPSGWIRDLARFALAQHERAEAAERAVQHACSVARAAEQRAQRAEAERDVARRMADELREALSEACDVLLDAQPHAVPATCGACEHHRDEGCERLRVIVDADQPPPEACPLRGKP